MGRKLVIKPRMPVSIVSGLPPDEHLFCLLVGVCGYSASKAYQLAISPDIQANSAAAMACRLLGEPRVQRFLWNLYGWREEFLFNEKVLKYQ